MQDLLLGLVLFFLVAHMALALWLHQRTRNPSAALELRTALGQNLERTERLERELRRELADSARGTRQELVQQLTQQLGVLSQTLVQHSAEATRTQNTQIDAFGQQLALLQKTLSDTLVQQLGGVSEFSAQRLGEIRQTLETQLGNLQQTLVQQSTEATRTQNNQINAFGQQLVQLQKSVSDTLTLQLGGVSESTARRMAEIRQTLETQLTQLQTTNATKLDEMRATVDEKLQSTLQNRLGESFKQVSEQLAQVYKGLGEMQTLAQGVGDLKHLLTNVKTRGMFGEAQLASLLEQVLVPDQYAAQIATRPGSKNVVDFAIKLPGKAEDGAPLWLPIDAKFPNDDYERLLDAQSRADVLGADAAAKALELRIRLEAKSIGEKYIAPPHTTDFAILFLPTEGLYAEVLRRPGLMESLQRDHRITLAGPTTLLAMLSALQMGFRTLALEKRSSEVWQVLGAVKSEFGKFGDVLAKVKSQTQTVLNTLDNAEVRSRAMDRALRKVEALPETQAQWLIDTDKDAEK